MQMNKKLNRTGSSGPSGAGADSKSKIVIDVKKEANGKYRLANDKKTPTPKPPTTPDSTLNINAVDSNSTSAKKKSKKDPSSSASNTQAS